MRPRAGVNLWRLLRGLLEAPPAPLSGLERKRLLASQVRRGRSSARARREAWLANLARVSEGHAVVFYLFLAVVLWGMVIWGGVGPMVASGLTE